MRAALQVDGMKAIKVFDPSTYGLTTRSNLTAKRWYPSTITLANGDIYIPGKPSELFRMSPTHAHAGLCYAVYAHA